MSRPLILRRLDAGLAKAAEQGVSVRAIYLTEADHDRFDAAMRMRFKCKGSFLAYGEHQIRRGKRTSIYSTHGVAIAVPTRLA